MKKPNTFVKHDLPVLAKMFLPALCIILVSFHYHEFVLNAILANKAINLTIIGVATYGIIIIYMRLLCMQRDMRGLDRFNREAQAGEGMKSLLDKPWLKGVSIRHYLENLAHTEGTLTSQFDQEAIQNELEALVEEYNSKMELPQFLVGFMVAMGLLGTFIGLLETLTGISGMLDGISGHGENIQEEFIKLVAELRKPLAGMGIAFSASMFGLVTSLMLALMMIMLRRYMSRVMEKARNVMHTLLTRIKTDPSSGRDPMLMRMAMGHPSLPAPSEFDESLGAAEANEVQPPVEAPKVDAPQGVQPGVFDELIQNIELLVKVIENQQASMLMARASAPAGSGGLNADFTPKLIAVNEDMLHEVRTVSSTYEEGQRMLQKIAGSLIQIDQSLMMNSTAEVIAAQRETTKVVSEIFSCSQTNVRLLTELLEEQRENNRKIVQLNRAIQDLSEKQSEIAGETIHQLSMLQASNFTGSDGSGQG